MLRDADPTKFAGIYVVCGFTQTCAMVWIIWLLSLNPDITYLFSFPIHSFSSVVNAPVRSRDLYGKVTGFYFLPKELKKVTSLGHVTPQMPVPFLHISLTG